MLKGTPMIESNLFEDCQGLVKKDLELWKSYFSKWEFFAKYEESIPESELLNKPFDKIKHVKKEKKMKLSSSNKKLKKITSLTLQKNKSLKKKNFRRTKVFSKCNSENKITKDYSYPNNIDNNVVADSVNDQMEIILKAVFTNFLRDNINKLEMFAALSQTCSNKERIKLNQLFSQSQQAVSCNELQSSMRSCLIMNQHILPSTMPTLNIRNMTICPAKDVFIQSLRRNLNFFDFNARSITHNNILNWTRNSISGDIFPKFRFSCKNDKNQQYTHTLQQTVHTNFDLKTYHSALFDGPEQKNEELKPFELDFSNKSPTNVFRKINKEYFVKKTFPKLNITKDEKTLKNLYFHEKTNSVSLSMENSNFVTSERKPTERKYFSGNILQRKKGHSSKLFFDDEEEDSENDDQTQNHAPLIYCKNTIKSQVIPEVLNNGSDSDDCEDIFDWVRKL